MAVIIEPNLDLLYAAMNGSLRGVKAALKAGADIDFDIKNSETFSPGTALYIASYKGHVDIVKLLLRKGASVSKRTRSSFGPLHGAATEGKTEVVDLLVQHGATLDIRDGFQNTPLMRACNYNHVDTVRRLIELGARPDLTGGQLQGMRYYKPGTEIGKGENEESLKLVEEARKSKLLRCCNPTCGKPGYRSTGTLKLCGRCKLTRYCSRDCQKQHWSVGHKKCCGHDAYNHDEADPLQQRMADKSHMKHS
ncbi:poly [ADP-ribose] polymerase tankyrase-2-like [Branchiostoma floridae]|uniref:Poly [ADP-ribose] polymerase tankyrase-2-like n=2 Tax=Branchiostoma floridae TaxID=7739 RepID=A0A9J7MTR4_BRAFL|nr:poly [ADP-ribose] polymerase tankyrase-2-like [Branchiostoma floridae]